MTAMNDTLPVTRAGIDTYREPVVYMHEDCHICRAEGFAAQTRIRIELQDRRLIATLNVVTDADWLGPDRAALSASAWDALAASEGDLARFFHPEPPASASAIRSKAYGERLDAEAFSSIVRETLDHRLSDLDLAAFVTACAGERLDMDETVALTQVMRDSGEVLDWGGAVVLDKHCVGGLPANRTTPIVVAIVAAAGYLIPKTSSRAITSPAGTADTMEVMAPVALDATALRRVVDAEGGCIVWGGGLNLSPADDHFIRIERPLDFDSTGQMVASILSKKAAVGASRVLIDIPIGPTAKVRSAVAAERLGRRLVAVGAKIGLEVALHQSDGSGPVGRGIGPALEAMDVLGVLRRASSAPLDLRNHALDLAGRLLDLASETASSEGRDCAEALLDGGDAEAKFMAICAAQGGFHEPQTAPHRVEIFAPRAGRLVEIDNRIIARIAKLSGAPRRTRAGVKLCVGLGEIVANGQPIYEIHAETPGELAWAQRYAEAQGVALTLEDTA